MQFDRTYRQIGDVNKPYPEYVFKPDQTDKKHYLGGGAFGEVFKGFALERNYQPVAVKRIQLKNLKKGANEQIKHSVDKEIEAFKKLKGKMKNENLLQIYDVLRSTNNLYIVMEYCRHGDLSQFLAKKKRLTETEAIEVLDQTCSALHAMHQINMIHRDIKPANILIDDGVYKVCDYGLSSVAIVNPHSLAYLSSVGSPLYAAPEILNGQPYNTSVDIFSTGVMVYEALFKFTPWPARSLPELIQKQKKNPVIKFPRHPQISKPLMDVLKLMCQCDNKKRPIMIDLFKDKNWQLITKSEDAMNSIQQQKDPFMKSIMMLNHQSRMQKQNGGVNQKVRRKLEELAKKDKEFLEQSDGIKAPEVKHQKVDYNPKGIKIGKPQNKEQHNDFSIQASQINETINNHHNLQQNFDQINERIGFDVLKVQLANQAIESFQTCQFYFKEIQKHFKSCIVFALAKYQCMKIVDLKRNLFNKKNIYGFDSKLWQVYLNSQQYSQKIADIGYQSKLSCYILQKLYSAQSSNFNHYYNTKNESFLKKVKMIFNKNIAEMDTFPTVFNTVKGLVGYILNEVQTEMVQQNTIDQGIWRKKLIASTYLLYVVMYEEYYKYNPKNQMTFGEITELVEKYGVDQLCKNLQSSISRFNKSQQK